MMKFFYLIPRYLESVYEFKTPKTVDELESLLMAMVEKFSSSANLCYLNASFDESDHRGRCKCFSICKGKKEDQGFIKYFAQISTSGQYRFLIDENFSSVVFVSPKFHLVRKISKMELIFDEMFKILREEEMAMEACTKGCTLFIIVFNVANYQIKKAIGIPIALGNKEPRLGFI